LRWSRDTLYPLKLALTSPTNGDHSVGIVCWRTKDPEVFFTSRSTFHHAATCCPPAGLCLLRKNGVIKLESLQKYLVNTFIKHILKYINQMLLPALRWFLASLILRTDDGGHIFFRNFRWLHRVNIAEYWILHNNSCKKSYTRSCYDSKHSALWAISWTHFREVPVHGPPSKLYGFLHSKALGLIIFRQIEREGESVKSAAVIWPVATPFATKSNFLALRLTLLRLHACNCVKMKLSTPLPHWLEPRPFLLLREHEQQYLTRAHKQMKKIHSYWDNYIWVSHMN
jgi:hypothetical protein